MIDNTSRCDLLKNALSKRQHFLSVMNDEDTNAYRLFHGSVEGDMGLTVDRYGDNLLIQSFHTPLESAAVNAIADFFQAQLATINSVFYHDRSRGSQQNRGCVRGSGDAHYIREAGIKYFCDMSHSGQDPLLFLDFRAARRLIRKLSPSKTLLNTFSFSCGIGISAAVGNASHVTNVDFASSALAAGKKSLQANDLNADIVDFIHEDYFLATRQMAGLSIPVRQRRGVKGVKRYSKQSFDIVVLDPPRWAKSKYGTVDLIRDYNSVFKPALLATKPGGQLFCTNNVAKVDQQEWLDGLQRCCDKNDRAISRIDTVAVDEDFPSYDNNHPLKQALITFV